MNMAGIQTGIELNDQFSSVLYGIVNSVNLAVSAMYDMQESMNADIDTSSIEGARDEINRATAAINTMNEALNNQTAPSIASPEPVEVPIQWETDNFKAFTGTGIERFQQEVQSANSMLEQLSSTQERIVQTAADMDFLPLGGFTNLSNMQNRLQAIQQRIQQIENNPLNLGTDTANAELEQLRSQFDKMVQEQNELSQAVQNMDVSAANDAYLRLSRTVENTERYIRDNVDEQGRFNQEIQSGTQQANQLTNTIRRAVAAYVSIQGIGKALNISDGLTQTIARLNLMNDGTQTTQELFDKIYISAQKTHSPLMGTADAIAKMGNNAGAAFSSNDELIAFMEQVNKQFVIGGASATEQSNAMLQLSQAMASGALRGDELNSILDAAPGIARTIEENMGWAEGSIKSYAEQGQVTAEVVKSSLLNMADETNAAFESMPITFSQAMTDFISTSQRTFQPVLQRLNDIANSQAFQEFVNNAIGALSTVAGIVLDIFDLLVNVAGAVADNWSWLSPIIYGVAGAFAVYYGWLLLTKGAEMLMSAVMSAKIGITALLTGSTMAATAAQMGYNGALYACPIVWIIILIIALIAIIFAVCNAIAEFTGIANSGFGVICGGVNVVIQFFKNLGLTVANIALGIANAIAALASNIMTAFHNAICSVQSWFYNLLSTALSVIAGICEALNKLPFVDFDYSGITSAADDYAAKAAEAAGNKEDYKNIGDAFNEGFNTFDTFQDGWISDAFDAGAAWGDDVADGVGNFISDLFGGDDIPNPEDYSPEDYTPDFGGEVESGIENSGLGGAANDIAGDTGAIKDAMDVTNEDLKYLRDIAEQEAINRFTTAEIKVDMSGMQNTVNSGDDIDGFMAKLTDSVNEAVDNMTEGVHE